MLVKHPKAPYLRPVVATVASMVQDNPKDNPAEIIEWAIEKIIKIMESK
jgi:hypothetical protein